MTGYVRLKTTIPHDSGLAEDAIVYTTAWMHTDDSRNVGQVALAAITNMSAFLEQQGSDLSSSYDPAHPHFQAYNMLDPEPRLPVLDTMPVLTISTAGPNDLPAELAIVVSYQAHPVSGLNQRRRRGRFYWGPLSFNISGSPDIPLIPNAIVTSLATAAWNNFVVDLANPDASLAVFSGYTAKDIAVGDTPTGDDDDQPELVPGAFARVDMLWVDNAWDTQRRRGLKATFREAFS